MGRHKKQKNSWSVERKHKITGAVFYLGPGRQVYWVTPRDHQKLGRLYGHWTHDEAYEELQRAMRWGDTRTIPHFDYQLVPHYTIHKPWKKIK